MLLQGDFVGNVSLGSADMSDVDGVETGFNLDGGTGWTNNGELEFDIKIKSIDPETRLFVKMDSGSSQGRLRRDRGSGRRVHGTTWRSRWPTSWPTAIPGRAPLDLSDIQNVFVLESTGPAHVWVDNIRLQCAFNTEPEWWQPDKTCAVKPRLSFPTVRSGFEAGPDRLECQSDDSRTTGDSNDNGEVRSISPRVPVEKRGLRGRCRPGVALHRRPLHHPRARTRRYPLLDRGEPRRESSDLRSKPR